MPSSSLAAAAKAGLRLRLGGEPAPAYIERLAEELATIDERGWARPYSVAHELTSWCRANGTVVGPGRGASSGSLMSWALGITEPDPLRHGLVFERFVNPSRSSLPDFDIDFGAHGFCRAVEHAIDANGPNAVPVVTCDALGADHVACVALPSGDSAPRTKHDAERAHTICLDLYGLDVLDGLRTDESECVVDDETVLDALTHGHTGGVPVLDAQDARDLLVAVAPRTFDDVIAVFALWRPGPIHAGLVERFIAAKGQGRSSSHPVIEEILGSTRGVLVWQEQVIELLHRVGGLSRAEADLGRRSIGKKRMNEVAALRDRFVAGAERINVNRSFAGVVFDRTLDHAGHAFLKAHAVPYGYTIMRAAKRSLLLRGKNPWRR